MKLKQDDILSVTIIDQGMDGEGIAKVGNYTLFVPFALPTETVAIKVVYVKKNLVFCRLLNVTKQSQYRVVPDCNRFTRCGGCDLLHQDYNKQLEWKKKNLEVLLRKNAKITTEVTEVVPSEPPLYYRNKIQLPIGVVNNKVAVGFYREKSHKIVSITKCFLHEDWVEKLIAVFLDYANSNNISVYDESTQKGILRHLVARYLDGQIAIVVVTNNAKLPQLDYFINKLNEVFPNSYALYYCPKKQHNNVVMGEQILLIVHKKITTEILGVVAEINPLSFLQLNNYIRDKIYNKVISLINQNPNNIVIDAYAGVGIIGAVLARSGATVYNIEIIEQATSDAERLAIQNKLQHKITNINGDASIQLPILINSLLDNQTLKDSTLNIIVDPPRKGCDTKVIDTLNNINIPHNLYYISCNPATLSRDLNLLNSYQINNITPFDMFPNTKHLETLVSLCKK